jgi:hypothetical protein
MESNYSSKYSGEQVDAAVEYYLNHSQIEDSSSYEYTNVIFCESTSVPSKPFKDSDLPLLLPSLPFAGIDGNLWYDIPNTSSSNWYQCVLKINYKSKKVVSQGEIMVLMALVVLMAMMVVMVTILSLDIKDPLNMLLL